jgi:hypothetical protein
MIKKICIASLCSLMVACGSLDLGETAEAQVAPVSGFTGLYESFSCDQLYSEARRIAEQMEVLATDYKEDVQRSRLEFVGGVVYWPVLLFVDGESDPTTASEYAQLKSRLDSLVVWMEERSCKA